MTVSDVFRIKTHYFFFISMDFSSLSKDCYIFILTDSHEQNLFYSILEATLLDSADSSFSDLGQLLEKKISCFESKFAFPKEIKGNCCSEFISDFYRNDQY